MSIGVAELDQVAINCLTVFKSLFRDSGFLPGLGRPSETKGQWALITHTLKGYIDFTSSINGVEYHGPLIDNAFYQFSYQPSGNVVNLYQITLPEVEGKNNLPSLAQFYLNQLAARKIDISGTTTQWSSLTALIERGGKKQKTTLRTISSQKVGMEPADFCQLQIEALTATLQYLPTLLLG